MPQAKSDERESGSAVFRALHLLEKVSESGRALTISELCALLDLPKATVHRLCQRLENERYLVREPGGRHFGIGPRLLRIGLDVVRSGASADRRAVLESLVHQIGETCNFTALVGHEVLYLDRVEARWPLRLHLEPGSRVPMHCTASGKLFLAFMDPERRKRALDLLELPPFTSHTIIERDALEKELSLISELGYSVDREEFLLGLVAIAVPVRNHRGETLAALACHGPSARFKLEEAVQHLPLMQAAAKKLGETLSD